MSLADYKPESSFFTPEQLALLDFNRVPQHIAIIPDGNRRWARKQELSVQKGHTEGSNIIMDTLRAAKQLGCKAVTFYAFSTENWERTPEEIQGVMWLIESYLQNELVTMLKEGVRLNTIGDLNGLPVSLQQAIAHTSHETKGCDQIELVLAINYGARDEIKRACQKIAKDVASGRITEKDIDEALISSYLDTARFCDPDLLIRTSGESRLSNFLLWQLSYAEVYISPVLWPDFTPLHLLESILAYQQRERRIGS